MAALLSLSFDASTGSCGVSNLGATGLGDFLLGADAFCFNQFEFVIYDEIKRVFPFLHARAQTVREYDELPYLEGWH